MTALIRFKRNNPIFWQEDTHFQRTSKRWRRWELFIVFNLLVLALLFILYLINSNNAYSFNRWSRGSITFFALMSVWIVHAIVVVRSIIAGVTVISREHVGLTWDALVLTGIGARQILFGKLRAVLRSILPWLALLTVLRVIMLPLLSYFYVQRWAIRCVSYVAGNAGAYSYGSSNYSSCSSIDWVPWSWLSAPIITLAMSVLEVVTCVSIGIAASAITRRSVPAAIVAISARFIPVAAFIGFSIYEVGETWFFRYVRFSPFTIADGGMSGLVMLINPLTPRTQGVHLNALPGIFGAIMVLGGMTLGSWAIAMWAIQRSGALSTEQATAPILVADGVPAYGVFRSSS